MNVPTWQVVILSSILSAPLLCGADFSSYRGFTLGSDVETAATQAGMKPSDAKLIHQRPAVIQEIELKGRPFLADPPMPDPVDHGVLCFMNGTLYRLVVTYDRFKIKGMTVEDLVSSISTVYGVAEHPETEIAFRSYYGKSTKVLARWEDARYAYDLVRTPDQYSFALVLYSKELDELAQAAILEAARLDAMDAPRKAQEAESKRLEDERLALEKARAASMANFRP